MFVRAPVPGCGRKGETMKSILVERLRRYVWYARLPSDRLHTRPCRWIVLTVTHRGACGRCESLPSLVSLVRSTSRDRIAVLRAKQ